MRSLPYPKIRISRQSYLSPYQQESMAYRQELVLRFFVQADYKGSASQLQDEYGEYVTKWMRGAAEKYRNCRIED